MATYLMHAQNLGRVRYDRDLGVLKGYGFYVPDPVRDRLD